VAHAVCFDALARMDDRPSGMRGFCGTDAFGGSRQIASPGCRCQRHSAGAGECARAQRLAQRSQRCRQCGPVASAAAAGDQAGSGPVSVRARRHINAAGGTNCKDQTNAVCGIPMASPDDSGGHQETKQADRPRYSQHLQGMLKSLPGLDPVLPRYPIGFSPASIAARRGSRNGGSASFSPSVAIGSSVAKPGPSVAISNRMPFGSRKYRLRK
jgi:hypothetical protein